MTRTTFLFATALLWSALVAPTRAQTDDDTRAHGHFLAGSSYFDQGSYDQAAEQFETAYSLSPRSALLLNMATAYERGGHYAQAADTIQRYLDAEPSTDDRRTLTERMTHLRERAAAEVAATAEPVHTPEPDATLAPEPVPPPSTTPRSDLETLGIVGIVVGAVGVVAAGAALGTGLVADNDYQTLDRTCGPGGSACPGGSAHLVDEGSTLAAASTALTIVGLVAVAAGVTLLVIDLTDGSGAHADVAVGPGDVGLSFRVRM